MYNTYKNWCEAKGIPAEAPRQFTIAMNKKKYPLKRRRNRFNKYKKPQFENRFQGCALYQYVTFEQYKEQQKIDAEEQKQEELRKEVSKKFVEDLLKDYRSQKRY